MAVARNNVLYIERAAGENPYRFAAAQKSVLDWIDQPGGEIVAVVPDTAANFNLVKGVWVYWRAVSARA